MLGVGISFVFFHRAQVADDQRILDALEIRAQWRAHDIEEKVLDASVPVEALSILMASQTEVTSTEFHRFAIQARGHDPIARLTWAPLITEPERPVFEATAKSPIRENDASGALTRARERSEYLPVLFEEQFERRPALLGYDFLFESSRRTAAERAREVGAPFATALVATVTRVVQISSYTLFWPVYKDGAIPDLVDNRRSAFVGVVTGSFRIDDVLSFAVSDMPNLIEAVSLFINPQANKPYGTPAAFFDPSAQKVEIGQSPLETHVAGSVRLAQSFSLFGQDWVLVFDFPRETVEGLATWARWWDLTIGLLLTVLLTTYLASEARRRRAVEAQVVLRTQDLRRTTDQLKAMIEASPHAIVCLDAERRVIIWNQSAEQIFGYTSDEVIGRPYPLIPVDDEEEFVRRFGRIEKGEVLRSVESRRRCKDGTIIETSSSAAAFYDAGGKLNGVIFAIEDARERNQIQRQLIHAQKLETVGQLTGGLAHDFNNILSAIIGNLDLAEEHSAHGSAVAEYCKKAIEAALSAAELVKRLLAFSRRQPLQPKPTNVSRVITTVLPLLMRTLGEHVRIKTTLPDGLWTVTSDPAQLESAILNLAVNARDAMPEGGLLSIEAANVTVDEAFALASDDLRLGDYVVLSLSDTGTGIPPDVLTRVLEPFFTTKAPGSGSGLGLSMVFGTMKQLGGTARIYSEVGHGTTVRLYLPKVDGLPENKESAKASDTQILTGHERILMVEDNSQIRAVGLEILTSLGYQVTVAVSGDDAIKIAEDGNHFDLLFSDVVMPGRLNGIALACEMRLRDPSVRILFASGFTNPETVRTEIDKLQARLLIKPYRKSDLAASVRSILDNGRLS
jgi:PAS domain S-box-containing protein